MARTEFLHKWYNSKEWFQARDYCIGTHKYLCEVCGEIAETAHHIVPLTMENFNDLSIRIGQDNLKAVCHKCHRKIHRELEGKRVIEFDEDGNLKPF